MGLRRDFDRHPQLSPKFRKYFYSLVCFQGMLQVIFPTATTTAVAAATAPLFFTEFEEGDHIKENEFGADVEFVWNRKELKNFCL
jgi:hypothetical protein